PKHPDPGLGPKRHTPRPFPNDHAPDTGKPLGAIDRSTQRGARHTCYLRFETPDPTAYDSARAAPRAHACALRGERISRSSACSPIFHERVFVVSREKLDPFISERTCLA